MADPLSENIEGVNQLVSSQLNKSSYSPLKDEGPTGEELDVLELPMKDEELLALSYEWENKYRAYEGKIKPRQEANKAFYLGKWREGQASVASNLEVISNNLIFEAEETFLPAALSKNPEPVVWADNTDQGVKLANDVKTMLQFHADTLVLRRKLTLMARHWSVYFLGVMKHGWDDSVKDIISEVRKPQNLILDPEGYIDCYANFVGYLGERIEITAEKLIELFPKAKTYIFIQVDGKLGTKCVYTEWWNDDYTFTTFKGRVLDKSKNPHFNYKEKQNSTESGVSDILGVPVQVQPKRNHFGKPIKPYTFLSVFSLGEQPHDITGLIEQNIPNQRRITRRTEQLDYNLSRANNSDVFSANNFNEETAKQAAQALAKGNPILVPQGASISEAIHRLQAPTIGSEFFNELEVSKQELRNIFGTQGITSQPADQDQTARGMILNQAHDTSRIGGGIGDALEQVADNIFNWWVQLYLVYYTEEHFAAIIGATKATEYVTLSQQDFDRQLVVSVSPDSMKPKDEISESNQAIQLFQMGALDPKTLLTVLNVPDPDSTAEATVLWILDKNAYLQMNFPELSQKLAQIQQQNMQAEQQAQQQQLAMSGAQGQQEMQQKEQAHVQKLTHNQQSFDQKQTLSKEAASAKLKQVKLPK